jgi:hypothetical protein
MSKAHNLVRIYLNDAGQTRAFYWVDFGADGSIYFGSSVRDFKRSGHLAMDISEAGARIEMDPSKLLSSELGGKHSLHNSGVLLGPRQATGRRVEHITVPIPKYSECIPLIGILLMVPLIYPRTRKAIRATDIVLLTKPIERHPLAFILYVQPANAPDAKVLDPYRARGQISEGSVTIRGNVLRAALYTDPDTFLEWPRSQVEVVARGLGNQPPMQFPMFKTSPRINAT